MKNKLRNKPTACLRKIGVTDSIIILPLVFLLLVSACNQNNEHSSQEEYTCPMHPTVIKNTPGTCPICGMDLVKKGKPGEEVKISAELNYLLKPTNTFIASSIKTIMPMQRAMKVGTLANGIISYDTRRFTSLPIRFGGRIEKLLVKYNFQPIREGQKILEIYSPELLTAQRDLLYLLKSDKENTQLIEGAKEKLRLLGLSENQINQLIITHEESYSFSVFSPIDGYITEEAVLRASENNSSQSSSSSMDGGMGNSSSQSPKQSTLQPINSELLIREGMYVSAGQNIFRIVNTKQVWAEFNVYQKDAALIQVNDPVELMVENSTSPTTAKVNFIQPFFDKGERFVNVRVYLENSSDKFKIGQLVKGIFTYTVQNSNWIPSTAILNLGEKNIVFIQRRGVFRPIEIITDHQSEEWVQVRSGLEENDSIAYNAQYMVDSESFIKVKN